MKKYLIFLAGLLWAGVGLSAVGTAGAQTSPPPFGSSPDDLSVSASSSVLLPADIYRVRIALDASGKSATEAQAAVVQKRQAVLAAVSAADKTAQATIVGNAITGAAGDTSPLTLQAAVKSREEISFEGSDLTKMSAVADAALGAGATQVEEASTIVRSAASVRSQAINAAVAEAQKKAESIAKSMGVSLGRALNVSVVEEPQGKIQRLRRQAGDDLSAMGDILMVLVNVRYEITSK